jgi:2-methylisocitrate lyase-like PEP mutase family enzyme
MTDFRALHRPGDPLLLPNAWDVASATALAAAGFAAVGTTSLGVAAAHGLPDGRGLGKNETLDLVRRLSALPVPLTVDIEGGFGGAPDAVADFVAELAGAGAAGINLEDGLADGCLAAQIRIAALIAAVKARVPDFFVNARTDTFWLAATGPDAGGGGADPSAGARADGAERTGSARGGVGDRSSSMAETLDRARAYLDAGADGIFVPAVAADDDIRTLTATLAAPVNVLLLPGMTRDHLAALGVAPDQHRLAALPRGPERRSHHGAGGGRRSTGSRRPARL